MDVSFTREKETKNTVRFQEDVAEGEPQVIGPLYVQKWALREMGNPTALTVTIEVPKTRRTAK